MKFVIPGHAGQKTVLEANHRSSLVPNLALSDNHDDFDGQPIRWKHKKTRCLGYDPFTHATFPCYARCRSGLNRCRSPTSPMPRVLNVPNQSSTVNQRANRRVDLSMQRRRLYAAQIHWEALKRRVKIHALSSLLWIVCTTGLNREDHFWIQRGLVEEKQHDGMIASAAPARSKGKKKVAWKKNNNTFWNAT